ncbi:hypothetical protein HNR46_003658 [Haloferula luteola]|uniref:Uncharacterized protein n=1 Tax=Haloferula luteola TaxID=595692 RepID=A0A840VL82_9BACT|nr:hypothetical protein [Haloferula luteola]MBB5353401.1 hypothetical protein [Haloferula luteola]
MTTEKEATKIQLIDKVIHLLDKSDPRWREDQSRPTEREIERLSERAEIILRGVERHYERLVYAYQLFEPCSNLMSPREIANRFKEVGWKGKTTHNSVRPLINNLLLRAEEHISAIGDSLCGLLTESPIMLSTTKYRPKTIKDVVVELEHKTDKLLASMGFMDVVADSDALLQAVVASITKCVDSQLKLETTSFPEERSEIRFAVMGFMKYVCGSDSIADYNSQPEKSIRPYELFLFAYQNGLEAGALSIPIQSLRNDALDDLSPSNHDSLSILSTHGGIDDSIAAWSKFEEKDDDSPLQE